MNLGELARSVAQMKEAAFLAVHKHPVLVVSVYGGVSKASPFQTLSGITHENLPTKPFNAVRALTDTEDDPHDDVERIKHTMSGKQDLSQSQVFSLAKSDRNPFANMITVGRAANNDVVLAHSSVSKMHAHLSSSAAFGWVITDNKSTNGTFVEGMRLPSGGKAPVPDGTAILFSPDVRATFHKPEGLFQLLARIRGD